MRKSIILLAFTFFFLFPLKGWTQQVTQYSQWSYNQFSINPALAGVKRCLDLRTAVRAQWLGFEGAPMSGLVTVNAPLKMRNNRKIDLFHGLGGKIEQDFFGPFNNFSMSVAYALHFPLGKTSATHRLSFGASAGIQQFGFDQSNATTIDADPAVAQSANHLLAPLLGFGVWYYTENFYVGAAIDQLAKNKWKEVGYLSRFRLHTKIQAGTKFSFENKFSLLPGLLLRIPPAGPASMDINLMVDYNNVFQFGLGYRTVDAVIGFLKVNIKQFTVGYSFDYITSSIRGGNFHSHEISIQYNGCWRRSRSQGSCPLFE